MIDIHLKPFKKKFQVKQTNKNMLLTYDQQLLMARNQDIEEKDFVEQIELARNTVSGTEEYLKTILKLTDKQQETLDDLEQDETIDLANYVMMRLMGMSDEDIKKSREADEDEPGED